MEEPTAAKEYIRSNDSAAAEAVNGLKLAVRALNRATVDLRFNLPPRHELERC